MPDYMDPERQRGIAKIALEDPYGVGLSGDEGRRCASVTGCGRYHCQLPAGHEGKHSDYPNSFTAWNDEDRRPAPQTE